MRRPRVWFMLALPLVALALAILADSLPKEDRPLVSGVRSWKRTPNFQWGGPAYVFANPGEADTSIFWFVGRYVGDGSGRVYSEPFKAPAWIGLIVTGDLTRPGNEVYFRPVDQDKRLRVYARTQNHFWRRVTCRVPADWVGKPIRLVAEAGPRDETNWFGLSSPRALGTGTVVVSHLNAVAILPAFAVGLALFLLPGLAPALRLAACGRVGPALVVPVAVVLSCLAGYVTFWAYFFGPELGFGFATVALAAGAAGLAAEVWRSRASRRLLLFPEVWTPLAATALVGAFYLALTYAVNLWVPFKDAPRFRFFEFILTLDNEIPYYFARDLYRGLAPHGCILGEWHYSDRPPLQAGLLLLQFPVGQLVGYPEAYAQAVGCAAQCAWVSVVWALCRVAGLPPRRAGLAVLFVTLTGFTLVNTVFTWPKMLGAALTVFAVTLALFDRGPKGSAFPLERAGLIGLSAALAFLAHGSVAFTLLPLGLILLVPRYFPGLARLAVAGVAFAAAAYPWSWFQSHYDPPGNLLIRQHVAGRSPTWDDGRPLWRNLLDAYSGLSPGQILENKLANAAVLFAASRKPTEDQYPWPPFGSPKPLPVDSTALRRCEFTCLFWAPGFLNLGWVVALAAAARRRSVLDPGLGYVVPALVLASVLTWVLLMFGPGSTVIHQGSYATVLLLLAALAAWITTLPVWLAYLVLILQAMLFAVGWLLTSPANDFGLPNVFMIPLAVIFFVLLVKVVRPREIPT